MKLIVISHNKSYPEEPAIILSLFKSGMHCFHLRKPGATFKEVEKIIVSIPKEYHDRIVLHNNYQLAVKYKLRGIHFGSKALKRGFQLKLQLWIYRRLRPGIKLSASTHSLSELFELKHLFDYIFLSPIFDSISKSGYQSGFKAELLTRKLENAKCEVIALGGVEPDKFEAVKQMNFSGAALKGAIWESDDPIGVFKNAMLRSQSLS